MSEKARLVALMEAYARQYEAKRDENVGPMRRWEHIGMAKAYRNAARQIELEMSGN